MSKRAVITYLASCGAAIVLIFAIDGYVGAVDPVDPDDPGNRVNAAAIAANFVDEEDVVEVADAGPQDLISLIAAADPADGERQARSCVACHSFEAGGAHKTGPNLHNIVGATKAAKDGFGYSDALAGMGGVWSHENLSAFLEDPKGYVPGTRMNYRGVGDLAERAAIIAYMRSETDAPPPLEAAATN